MIACCWLKTTDWNSAFQLRASSFPCRLRTADCFTVLSFCRSTVLPFNFLSFCHFMIACCWLKTVLPFYRFDVRPFFCLIVLLFRVSGSGFFHFEIRHSSFEIRYSKNMLMLSDYRILNTVLSFFRFGFHVPGLPTEDRGLFQVSYYVFISQSFNLEPATTVTASPLSVT